MKRLTKEQFAAWLAPRAAINAADGDDACWVWLGAMTGTGMPSAWLNERTVSVSREAWEIHSGAELGRQVLYPTCCARHRCVNPAHKAPMTVKAYHQRLAAEGHYVNPVAAAKKRRAARARSPLDLDKVAQIRRRAEAGESQRDLAKAFKVVEATISRVVLGQVWADAARGSSVFAWRPAA